MADMANVIIAPMSDSRTVIDARWIITADKRDRVYDHHSLVIDGSTISSILPTDEAHRRFPSSRRVDLPAHALTPGLVNTHTHAAMTLLRGMADDYALDVWLNEHIWPAEGKWVSDKFVEDGTRLAFAEMIKSGTTCMNDMYFFPDTVAAVAQDVNMRACVGLIVLEFPTVWATGPDEYLTKGRSVHKDIESTDLVTAMLSPHAPYTVSDATFGKISDMSANLGIGVHIHVHETAEEIESSMAQHGMRPIERLSQLNMVNSRFLAVHATQLNRHEIELLAKNGSKVAHCPKSNLKLASGMCPVNDLHCNGVTVGIGTDGAASNNTLDMLEEMRFAALLGKGVSCDPTAVSARKVLRMATIEAAQCLGLDDEIGSLEPGKSADLAVFDLGVSRSQPVYEPVGQIVYTASSDQVTDVWINGARVLENRVLKTIDESECKESAARWAHQIRQPHG